MILLFTDLHFGTQGFNKTILNKQLEYFEKIVFPYIISNNIKEVCCLGDLFDNRTNVDIYFDNEIKKRFIKFFNDNKINFHIILGNHDVYYKNIKDVNSIQFLESEYVKTYVNNFYEVQIDGYNICIIPWIVESVNLTKKYDIILGHFEFKDFKFNKYIEAQKGLDYKIYSDYARLILSGHYHIRSQRDNIVYLGSPYQLNWNDFDTKHGIYVIDNFKLKFIENTFSSKFIKIYYTEKEKEIELKVAGVSKENEIINVNTENIYEYTKNNYVKLIINNIINQNLFDVFYNNLLENNFQEKVEVINSSESLGSLEDIVELNNISEENILETSVEYIKKMDSSNLDKTTLTELFKELFHQSEEIKFKKRLD